MIEEERYLFDLMGYLVVDDVLSPADLAELNGLLDEYDLWRGPDECPVNLRMVYSRDRKVHVGWCYQWHEAFRRIINHAKIMPYLLELIGPEVRFDHDYVILMKAGGEKLELHSGAEPFRAGLYYHYQNGRMHNGLLVVSYALGDVGASDGGFAAIPGSHKANFACPDGLSDLERRGPWLQQVPQRAGSAILFTEALTHGTLPWTGAGERRSLLYKYSPGPMSWLHGYPSPSDVPDADWSDELRRMLEPPYIQERVAVPDHSPTD